MKRDDLSAWEAFHGVATHGSFSGAARHLRLGVPQLSKRVSRLESDLGVRLFARSTRRVSLTDEGRSILPKVSSLLEDVASLESTFESHRALSGTIRLTSVPFVAHRLLLPALSSFAKAHPQVQFELELSERMVNLVEANMDMAIRIHDDPKDTTLVYRKLASNDLVLCASPKYLTSTKAPLRTPSDLRRHPVLMLDVHRKCRFSKDDVKIGEVAGRPEVRCDNGWFLTELALEGRGVLVRSIWDVRDHLKRGKLVRVLEKHPLDSFGNIYAVVPSRKYLAPRVRAFLDLIQKEAESWR